MNPFSPQGGGILCLFWWTQLDITWVWGVRGGQNFFCYELWTHWDPLGVRPAPKSIFTHQAHPLKLVVPKMAKNQHFGSEGMTPPDGPKYFSVRIRSRNVLSGPSLIKWRYKHFHSPSRTDSMSPWKLHPRALLVNYPLISLKDSGQNFQKFRWSKITSKDTSSTWISRRKMLGKYMHPSGT